MKAILFLCILFVATSLSAQNLVGLNEKEIMQYMKDNEKGFVFQSLTNNSTFRYLKYTDRRETQTLLFFLDSELRCKTVRLVCEKAQRAAKIKELDGKYKKSSENTWEETKDGITYLIELREEDTTFNITINKKE